MEVGGKMKIAHVLKSSIYSGAENVVLTIMNGLKDQFDFIYIATEGPIREKLEEEGVPFLLLERFDRKNLGKALKKAAPDIVHAHDFSATVLCASLPGRFRLISHLHYDPPWTRKWNGKTAAYVLCQRKINKLLTVSRNMLDSMVFAEHFRGKLQVVSNPIERNRIREMSEAVEDDGQRCDLIFVGRFVEQKNPQRFIRLVKKVQETFWPEVTAWMLGQGELWEECRRLILDMGLQDHVKLKGFQANPYSSIRQARLLCITSRWEGFGLVAAEANVLGVPVLSTDNSGCREILGAKSPELCGNDEEFAEKIRLLYQSPQMYEQWKQRSLERAEGFISKEVYAGRMASIYKEMK